MEDEFQYIGELINLETDLFNSTKILFDEIILYNPSSVKLPDFRLAEIYSLRGKLDLFLKLKFELGHYQLTSLISFWDQTFHEIKEVIKENDSNLSFMSEEYENYKEQHKIVDTMLRNQYSYLKEQL